MLEKSELIEMVLTGQKSRASSPGLGFPEHGVSHLHTLGLESTWPRYQEELSGRMTQARGGGLSHALFVSPAYSNPVR